MNKYIVRYSGELGTKDKATRWRFINKLAANIGKAIIAKYGKAAAEQTEIHHGWDRTFVTSPERIDSLLARIAGIKSFSKVTEQEFENLDDLAEKAGKHFVDEVTGKAFAVRCKRKANNCPFSRKDIEIKVGDRLVKYGKVNLSNPEITCYVDIGQESCYFYTLRNAGIGGYPVGSQGKALTLLSGGIDSPVAVWYMFRKGIDQNFLYFDLGGAEQKGLVIRNYKYLVNNWGAGSKGKLIIVDFIPVINEIMKAPTVFQNMVLKYCFYKTAEVLVRESKAEAIITGESIGQVSTQTLKNLLALDQVIPHLVVRPLAVLDKEEITAKAQQIGTYEMAYKGKELCALAGKGVVTGTSYKKLLKIAESLILMPLIEEALSKKQVIGIDDEAKAPGKEKKGQVLPEDRKIIDLRTADEVSEFPIGKVENIPFQEAWADFYHWDKDEKYFLVCNVGNQSAMLMQYMEEEGFDVEQLEGGVNTLKTYQKS